MTAVPPPTPCLPSAEDRSPLRSEFADDPEFAVILMPYVAGAEDKIRALRAAATSLPADREPVTALAHQIKGSAGGYGFPQVTEAAADLLSAARGGTDDEVAVAFDRLLTLLGRIAP